MTQLLTDPSISAAIYDLPSPITLATVRNWICDAQAKRERGEALLTVRRAPDGAIYSYSYFTIWPDLAAAEIAGGFRAEQQSAGLGKTGAQRSFAWMFDALQVRLICVTAALDNVRSAKVIEAAGFTPGTIPTNGTGNASRKSAIAAAEAVLHATTMSLTPLSSSRWVIANDRLRTSGAGRGP